MFLFHHEVEWGQESQPFSKEGKFSMWNRVPLFWFWRGLRMNTWKIFDIIVVRKSNLLIKFLFRPSFFHFFVVFWFEVLQFKFIFLLCYFNSLKTMIIIWLVSLSIESSMICLECFCGSGCESWSIFSLRQYLFLGCRQEVNWWLPCELLNDIFIEKPNLVFIKCRSVFLAKQS